MLLRDAVCPPPHLPAVVRVAGAVAVLTAFVTAGAVMVCGNRESPRLAMPTIGLHDVTSFRSTTVATPDELALARRELTTYAFEAYPAWAVAHPDRMCPDRLLELNRFSPALHAVDPWGTPYQFLCGTQHGVAGLKMRSAGPDRTFDTTDDLRH